MRIRVLRAFDYTPSAERRVTYAYAPSAEPVTVKQECGEAAIARGDAETVDEPAQAPLTGKVKSRARGG
jgi:hypothetical protein